MANVSYDPTTDKIIRQLESDLSEFLIDEMSPPNPAHRNESEMYKYKGLMLLSIDQRKKRFEKTFLVRIGTLEAEFSLINGEKIHGALGAEEDKLILKWFKLGDNASLIQTAYRKMSQLVEQEVALRPFDIDDDDDDI